MAELSCDSCGRRFVFKPEYAGKTLKCKCGQAIKAPAAVPGAAPAKPSVGAPVAHATAPKAQPAAVSSGGDDFSKLFAEAEAEYEMAPEPPPSASKKPPIARPAPAAAGAVPTSPMLAYSRAVSKPPADDATKAAIITDLYIPIGMIIVGLVAYMYDAHVRGAHNAIEASVFVFVSCALNLALVFGALMAGVQILGLGLGPIWTALLKIAAVGILPAAVGDLILWYSGISLMAWGITLIMYYLMLFWLFDMDGGEIRIVTGIMWAVQFLLGMFVLGALMSGIGLSGGTTRVRPGSSVSTSLLSGPSEADAVPDDASMTPAEIDKASEDAITSQKATEAHEWLDVKYRNHNGLGVSASRLRQLADALILGGAKKVWTSAIEKQDDEELCTRLIVEMPQDPGKRSGILYERDKFEERDDPSKDGGGKYITVMIRNVKPKQH